MAAKKNNTKTVEKKSDASISRAGFDEDTGAKKCHSSFRIMPSKIRADHYNDNHDRAAMYSLADELPELAKHPAFADDRFCFKRHEVLQRAESFKKNGQQEPLKVFRSNTHKADVAAGFLRHAAGLFLEVTGQLDDAPGLRDGLRCDAEERPKDQLAEVGKNTAENESKDRTPIDRAWLCRRYKQLGKTTEEIGQLLVPQVDKRVVDRYLQLLNLTPQEQLDIHEGRLAYSKALDKQSKKGKGTAKGERPGAKHKLMRAALDIVDARPLPSRGLNAKDAAVFVALVCGALDPNSDEVTEQAGEWFRAVTPTLDEVRAIKAKTAETKKKAPPKQGKNDEATT